MIIQEKPTVGLFGTCGKSTWRKAFIEEFERSGIHYYNPQVENWTPECAASEAQHLLIDDIILFPVTAETEGFGSLAETGYAAWHCASGSQYLIVFIDPTCSVENPANKKLSINTRALVAAHLKEVRSENIFVVTSLEQMLELAIRLAKRFNYLRP